MTADDHCWLNIVHWNMEYEYRTTVLTNYVLCCLCAHWALGLGEIGPEDPNFKIKTWALGF